MNQFYKTKICPWYFKGRCERGHLCRFAHGETELRTLPNLFCTSLCPDLVRLGHCPNSETCRFAHSSQQLRATDNLYKTSLCFHWMKGRCEAGSQCRHAHGHPELRLKPVTATTNGVEQRAPAGTPTGTVTGAPPQPPRPSSGTSDVFADWAAPTSVPVPPTMGTGVHNFQKTAAGEHNVAGTPVAVKSPNLPLSKIVESVVLSQIVSEYSNGASLETTKAMIDAALTAASNVAAQHASAAATQSTMSTQGAVGSSSSLGMRPSLAVTSGVQSNEYGDAELVDRELLRSAVDAEMLRRQQLLQLYAPLPEVSATNVIQDKQYPPNHNICTNTGLSTNMKLVVTPDNSSPVCFNCSCTGAKSTNGYVQDSATVGRTGRLSGNHLGVSTSPNRAVSADIYAPRTRDPLRDATSGPSTPHGLVSCMTAPEVSPVLNAHLNLLDLGDSLNELTNRLTLAEPHPTGLFDHQLAMPTNDSITTGITTGSLNANGSRSPLSAGNWRPPPCMFTGTHSGMDNEVFQHSMLNSIYRNTASRSLAVDTSALVYHSQPVSETGSNVQLSPVTRRISEPVSRVNSRPSSTFLSNIEESPVFDFDSLPVLPSDYSTGLTVPDLDEVDLNLRSSVDAALIQLVTACLQFNNDPTAGDAMGDMPVQNSMTAASASSATERTSEAAPDFNFSAERHPMVSSNKTPHCESAGTRSPSDCMTTSSTPPLNEPPNETSANYSSTPQMLSLQLLSPDATATTGAHTLPESCWALETADVKRMDAESKTAALRTPAPHYSRRSLTPVTSCSSATAVSNINSYSSNYLNVGSAACAIDSSSTLVSTRCSSAVDECEHHTSDCTAGNTTDTDTGYPQMGVNANHILDSFCTGTILPSNTTGTFNNKLGHHNQMPWDSMTT